MVEPPVVDRDDRVEVGDEAELGGGRIEVLGEQAAEGAPPVAIADQPGLLRGGVQIAPLAERAVPAPVVGVDVVPASSVSPRMARLRLR